METTEQPIVETTATTIETSPAPVASIPQESTAQAQEATADIKVPAHDASPADWKAYFQSFDKTRYNEIFNVPSKVEDYGLKMDSDLSKSIYDTFLQAGVSKEQAEQITAKYDEIVAKHEAEEIAQIESFKSKEKQEIEELKKEWGDSFNKNNDYVARGVKIISEKAGNNGDILNVISGLVGYKETAKFFSAIGEMFDAQPLGMAGDQVNDVQDDGLSSRDRAINALLMGSRF